MIEPKATKALLLSNIDFTNRALSIILYLLFKSFPNTERTVSKSNTVHFKKMKAVQHNVYLDYFHYIL